MKASYFICSVHDMVSEDIFSLLSPFFLLTHGWKFFLHYFHGFLITTQSSSRSQQHLLHTSQWKSYISISFLYSWRPQLPYSWVWALTIDHCSPDEEQIQICGWLYQEIIKLQRGCQIKWNLTDFNQCNEYN